MSTVKIAFINASTLVTDSDAKYVMAALQVQVSRDFFPIWGVNAELHFFRRSASIPTGYWWLTLLDNSDQASNDCFHDVTSEGLPLGKVFINADLQNKSAWSVGASHELLEMLVDPDINHTVLLQSSSIGTTLYAYEVCDPCEADEYGYKIGDILVSDFVFPSWFENINHPKGTQFDFKKKIKKPFELLKHGYINILRMNCSEGWTQLKADNSTHKYSSRAKVGTRRERRRTLRDQWLASDTKLMGNMKMRAAMIVDETKPITFRVTIYDGNGGISFYGPGMGNPTYIDSNTPKNLRTFTVQQPIDDMTIISVWVDPPAGGSIEILVKDAAGTKLIDNTFKKSGNGTLSAYAVK